MGPACSPEEIEEGMRSQINLLHESYIDRYYVVGMNFYEVCKKVYGTLGERIKLTGWPRVDLWRKKFRYLYEEKIKHIKNKHGEFFLFSSDFGFVRKKDIQKHFDYLKSYGWNEDEDRYKYELKRANNFYYEFRLMMKLLVELDQSSEATKIIIRPHPADDLRYWKKVSKIFKNIKVIYEGDINEWLYASRGLIHRGCTTAIQSYMADIPTGYIVTKKEFKRESPSYFFSQKLESKKQIIEFMDQSKIKKK